MKFAILADSMPWQLLGFLVIIWTLTIFVYYLAKGVKKAFQKLTAKTSLPRTFEKDEPLQKATFKQGVSIGIWSTVGVLIFITLIVMFIMSLNGHQQYKMLGSFVGAAIFFAVAGSFKFLVRRFKSPQ